MWTTMCETNKYQTTDKIFSTDFKIHFNPKINNVLHYYVNLVCYTNDIVSELNITLQRLTRFSN